MENKTEQFFKKLILSAMMIALSACSVKAGGGAEEIPVIPPGTPEEVFDKPAIIGPDMTGKWTSACVEDYFTGGSRRSMIQYEKNNFKYAREEYSDKNCKDVTKNENFSGIYQFSQRNPNNEWIIDYNYKIGNVIYRMSGQMIQFEGDVLYISEFVFGNIAVNRNLPFKKATANYSTYYSGLRSGGNGSVAADENPEDVSF